MNRDTNKLADFRQNYTLGSLSENEVAASPYEQFDSWLQAAIAADFYEPNAMFLATATPSGIPSIRTVLLKEVDILQGFVFYTNYDSRKGREIAQNPHAALLFYWDALHRQVRIEGKIEKVSPVASDRYFASRPLGSQIGALVSPQSQVIVGREVLEKRMDECSTQYEQQQQAIVRPEHWGGYALLPHYFEFWQGRTNRLHDRLCYTQNADTADWYLQRLAP